MKLISKTGFVVSLGITQTLAWGSTYYLPAILATPIARDLELSIGWVFGAFSAALIVGAVLGPLAGREIDRRGGRDVLVLSNLVFATGLAMLGLSEEAVLLFISWLVIGAGMAMGLYEAAFSTLASVYGRDARSPITGITLIAGFASTVCWPISAYLDAEVGWRTTCFIWAAAHILIGLPLNRLMIPAAELSRKIIPHAEDTDADQPNRTAALLAFVFAVTWFISTAMAAHLPRLLQEAGASTSAAVAAAALIGPSQVAARIAEFGFLRRLHPLLSARLAAIAHPIGVISLLFAGAPAAALFVVLHGAGNGIMTIAKGTLPLAIFGAQGYGFRQGLLMVPARFSQAAAPFIFAVAVDRWGVWSLVLSAVLGFGALIALLAINYSASVEKARGAE